MKKKILYAGLAALIALPAMAMAEETETDKIKTLGEVVVTATRSETTTEKIGGTSVTIITADEIAAKKQNTLKEVLRGTVGIDLATSGTPGAKTSVFLRGAKSKDTLVLVDGIMLNDSADPNRAPDLANITMENIERIEIVRGPLSALYGSNATAGVINIITKKGTGKPSHFAGVEGGSYKTWKVYGGTGGSVDKFNYSLSASRIDTEGFSAANKDNDLIPQDGSTSEKDGWQNTTVSGKFGFDISTNSTIDAVFRYMDSEIEFDAWNGIYDVSWNYVGGYAADDPDPSKSHTENEQLFGKFSLQNLLLDDFVESNLYVQGSSQDRQSFDSDGLESYDFLSKNKEIGWQGSLHFVTDSLTFGASYFEEKYKSGSDNQKADTKSIWIQNQFWGDESLDVVAGVRVDDHKRFGSKAVYRIAPAFTIISTQTLLKASYGTGFRAPSLYELFHPIMGNKDLEPEKSVGWDVGFEQSIDKYNLVFGATYFDTTYKNRIAFDSTIPTIWGGAYNQAPGKTETSGVEFFAKYQASGNLDFSFNYSYLSTEDYDGSRLQRIPKHKCSLNMVYRFMEKGLINADVIWVDDRPEKGAADLNSNPVTTLNSYTLVNVSVSYDVTEMIQVYGRIDNLFDEEYEEQWSYATPGLSAYLGLKFTL